ncbi:unnamed protein product [Rhizoctonia solani]|uniref:Uncharacterized protein n=1 Tax=Rhizoctonia solani TaxID=456999 RepID=A0A8H2ZZ85_9AGAM|nr:unnamed protein product [Rhizoctonia solani]
MQSQRIRAKAGSEWRDWSESTTNVSSVYYMLGGYKLRDTTEVGFKLGIFIAVRSDSYSTASGLDAENESAIWTYTPETNAITAHRINSDGSAVAIHLLYANDGNDALLLTGYPDGIRERFGTNYPEVWEIDSLQHFMGIETDKQKGA